jgi:hypothetical protein
MQTIWKYPIAPGHVKLILPEGAEILCVQVQGEEVCLWAKVDTDKTPTERRILTYGTGHDMEENVIHRYIGTFQLMGGLLIFHSFEELQPPF